MDQEQLDRLLDFIVDLVLLLIISLFLSYGWGVYLVYVALLRAFVFLCSSTFPEVPEHRLRERWIAREELITLILLRLGILEEEPEH